MKDWSILARKANPTNTPVATIHRVPARSMARTNVYAAAVSRRTMRASGLLNRNISAATGVHASAAPASSPAGPPNHRLTVA